MNIGKKRTLPLASAGAALLLTAGATFVGASPASAAEHTPTDGTVSTKAGKGSFNFTDASYILTLRSGGLEPYAYIPRDLPTDVGFSYVDLIHDIGQPQGRCEAFGAGYWLGTEAEEGVLGAGAAPPDAGDVSGGYRNPTTSRNVEPNLSAGENQSNRNPGLKNYFPPGNEVVDIPEKGSGPTWTAKCDGDAKGTATGNNVDVGGVQALGSTSTAAVDKTTGVYTGNARAFVVGVEGASGFDSFSSAMQVVNKPNAKPVITYRMSFFNSGEKESKSGFTISGTDVPIEEFTKQYNAQAKQFTAAAKAVGPIGSSVLTPEVGVSTDGGRYSITLSAAQGYIGFAAREGTIGQQQGMRFGATTFQGVYGA